MSGGEREADIAAECLVAMAEEAESMLWRTVAGRALSRGAGVPRQTPVGWVVGAHGGYAGCGGFGDKFRE